MSDVVSELLEKSTLEHAAENAAVEVIDGCPHCKIPPEDPGETVLQEANRLIYGDRNAQYDDPNRDFKKTADMWTGLFQYKMKDGARFTPEDVALAMILLKCSRAVFKSKRDTYVDIAGYAGCGWRCVESESARAPVVQLGEQVPASDAARRNASTWPAWSSTPWPC